MTLKSNLSYSMNPKRRLLDDVDISTLYSMREDGMTNQQIADKFGVSNQTIRNHIGKQPRKEKKNSSARVVERTEKKVEPMPEKPKASSLKMVSMRQTLQGSLCNYIVDTVENSIEIDGGGILTGMLDKDTLDSLIQELIEIRYLFQK